MTSIDTEKPLVELKDIRKSFGGVQVIGAPWREDLVLRVAAALEGAGVVEAPVASL